MGKVSGLGHEWSVIYRSVGDRKFEGIKKALPSDRQRIRFFTLYAAYILLVAVALPYHGSTA